MLVILASHALICTPVYGYVALQSDNYSFWLASPFYTLGIVIINQYPSVDIKGDQAGAQYSRAGLM